MTKKTFLVAAGAVLAFTTAAPALAQVATNDKHAIVTTSKFTGTRAAREGDNDVRGFDLAEYRAFNAQNGVKFETPEAELAHFQSMVDESASACRQSGSWIAQTIAFKARRAVLAQRLPGLMEANKAVYNDLYALGRGIDNTANARTGAHVIGTAALCLIPGVGTLYCVGAVAGGVSNELGNRTYKKQSKLNRKQSMLAAQVTAFDLETRQLDLDTRELDFDQRIAWSKMIAGYCQVHQADAYVEGAKSVTMSYTPVSTTQASSTAKPKPKQSPWQ